MARDGKRFELKTVSEEAEALPPVIRLESEETLMREKPASKGADADEAKVSQRLDIPDRDDSKIRTHEPGIETLIEPTTADPNALEQDWGAKAAEHKHIPWGWFALIGLMLAAAVIWSLTRVQQADGKAEQIQIETQAAILNDELEDEEAGKLVDRIRGTITRFFEAQSIDDLLECTRQPERVRSLMKIHHKDSPIHIDSLKEIRSLQPITLDQRGNFWIASVSLQDGRSRNMILEVMPTGEVLVDWETFVCYQPMQWEEFVKSRPEGTSLDFRVYIQPDNFFSHEFADADQWNSYRITTLHSDEALFGYAQKSSEIATGLQDLLRSNRGRRTSVILRLGIPEGLKSRSGVVIEKFVSPRWLYVDPPDEGS